MSLNIPKDPRAIDSSQIPSQPSGSAPDTPRPLISTRDALAAASTDEVSARSTPRSSATPELITPQSPSSVDHFKIWIDALRSFRNQLSASELANLEVRSKFSKLALQQAQEFAKLISNREEILAQIKDNIKAKLEELQKQISEMQELAKQQQAAIDQINGGNKVEQEQYAKLKAAYEDYLANLAKIGVKDLGNGQFLVPESAREKFNELTSNYQQIVGKFNTYWAERVAQINKYNTATAAYNNKVAEYNALMERFIQDNNLADYLKQNKITLPQLSPASRRDISGYQERIDVPSKISSAPVSIPIPPLPAYVRDIAQAGPSALPKLPNFPSFDAQSLFASIYKEAYTDFMDFIDQHGLQYTNYWSFIMDGIEGQDLSAEPLLNSKKLAQKLGLPRSSASSRSLAMQALGTDNPQLQILLGKAILKEVLEGVKLEALEKLNREEKEKQLEQLADRILLLSLGLLGTLNTQALFPSLGIISDVIASLPKDSPVIAILFAISLANRIQENVQQGLTMEAVQQFLSTIPELATLSTEDKAKLGAAISLGQLLIAGKLLEENLGIQGLCAQILPFISPALNPAQILSQAEQENQEDRLAQQHHIKEHFIHQGYSEEQAHFLAQVGVELTEQGLLTPQITSSISAKSIHQPTLENSIKAELILAHYSLEEASQIAQEAITQTLAEGPFTSAKQFRAALESHLTDLQVKNSADIAMSAILIPADKGLAPVTTPPTSTRPATRPVEGVPIASTSPTTSTSPTSSTSTVTPTSVQPAAATVTANAAPFTAPLASFTTRPTPRPAEGISAAPPTPSSASTSTPIPAQSAQPAATITPTPNVSPPTTPSASSTTSTARPTPSQAEGIPAASPTPSSASTSTPVPAQSAQPAATITPTPNVSPPTTPSASSTTSTARPTPSQAEGIPAASPTPSSASTSTPIPAQTTQPAAPTTSTAVPPIASSPSSPSSPNELIAHIEKQVVQLLTPQLGAPLAKQVSQEVARTLFGTAHSDNPDKTQVAPSPYALVSAIRDQLQHFDIHQDHQWAHAVTETFKESIKTMESFYAFSLKLMNPAYLYVFASSIIYEDKGRKKHIDIPI